MKKKQIVLAVLAVVLVLSSSIGIALAYFTDTDADIGEMPVAIDNRTDIKETVEGNIKTIQIQNTGDGPVFVRFKVIATPGVGLAYSGTNWDETAPEGTDSSYLYYNVEVPAGGQTEDLTVTITFPTDGKKGDEVNVTVLYESVPAVYLTNGNPDFATAWQGDPITIVG